MNLGDGLLFELENGKPRLILLSRGVEKNAAKPSFRPRAPNVLSSRQPSCVEEVQGEERRPRQLAGRHREARSKAGGAAASFSSNTTATEGRSTTLTSCKTHEHHKGGGSKVVAKVKTDRHKHSSTVGPLRVNGKTGPAQNTGTRVGGKAGLKEALTSLETGLKENMVCLTSEQLQQILNTVQTSSNGQHLPDDHQTQGRGGDHGLTGTAPQSGEGGGEMKKEDKGGRQEAVQKGGEEADTPGSSQEKDSRLSGCLFSWLEERQSDSRAAIDAKKAQWKKELDEQVAQKQQQHCSAPGRLQAEEDADSVLSVQSCVSHREQPAAIRSSLRLGEVTPMEEVLSVERKEEQRRRWLEELDRQREETTERKKQEKLLQSQTENVELWATHFDSLQRRPPLQPAAPSAPPPAQFSGSERGEWEPTSSLSLVWEAMSSCGAESVGGVSVDTVSGFPTRTSYLRTMTSLLDPAQIEERERRRLKQLEQQRAIEAQMEERRQQREREQAKRRQEEEAEERRVALEREMLQRQYEMDTLREKQKEQPVHQAEQPQKGHDDSGSQETLEPSAVTQQAEGLEDATNSAASYKDSAVQTDAALSLTADRVQTPDISAQYQPPPPPPRPPPPPPATAPPNSRSRAARAGKENICLPAGGDPYEAFARRDKKRPEWNTQRPNRRFVPASERYPVALQRNRQESRLKRQAELLALQERTCLSRTDPPIQNQEPCPCPNPTQSRTSPTRKVENGSRGQSSSTAMNTERGRSPPVPTVRHRVPSRQASTPPPVLEFVPYVRTDEVFNMDPLEPADTPPPPAHTAAPAPPQRDLLLHPHTHRQQEILRGLAQLRQGLLQKQRELETDLNPLLSAMTTGAGRPRRHTTCDL
ncbi:LOW QUALITY PROTEIN: coiled-coil domain-containing protein 66 [Stegastes partitus]|uniref:LOW QUALITY PROTEIN: coiled-coil domain-containing protein 66 n=1 Tax=Stegastes partitus TaxID=144197 RepID=A0A9Y4NLK9_9TELE|nr:PREDICTED: LOW QUALITY PROTEIN: coiled-coil domain-containing protein 66 [Stegastes partitus]